jgi:hypothetical protein
MYIILSWAQTNTPTKLHLIPSNRFCANPENKKEHYGHTYTDRTFSEGGVGSPDA